MSRLFVDVDDTLVKWVGGQEPHPYGYGAERWEVNDDVVTYIDAWRARHPGGKVIIWSGGGKDYASTWAERLLPGKYDLAESKMAVDVRPDDLFIDDSPFDAWAKQSTHPRDLTYSLVLNDGK